MKHTFSFLIALVFLFSCSPAPETGNKETPAAPAAPAEELVPVIEYDVTGRLPHDTRSFTEGLFFHNGQLYESTGSPDDLPDTRSVFGIMDMKTGKIDKKAELDKKYFGEGIVLVDGRIYQLTYKDQVGFIYDAKTYKKTGDFHYKNEEGWGMTTDGTSIIMSDGTDVLTYWDPKTLAVTKTLSVTNGGYPEDMLNELEYIEGYIYANVWTRNYVIKIDPATGKTAGIIDFSPLKDEARNAYSNAEVLNGIAYDAATKKMYVTGKLFPFVFEIKLK